MITLIYICLGLVVTAYFLDLSKMWATLFVQMSFLIFTGSVFLISPKKVFFSCNISYGFVTDNMNMCLILLSLWLIPVSLLASINHLNKSPLQTVVMFSVILILILMFLIMTFSSDKLLILFLGFEATLIPTMFLIARWGARPERMEASYYLVFYTLVGSLPLFLSLLFMYKKENHLSILYFSVESLKVKNYYLAIFCLMAFLMKVPVFGVHLWLPKAHVEAPVAGSMMLAAMLLKMGGYGFMRLMSMFQYSFMTQLSPMLIPYCCWGGSLASMVCLTQTDLKSLMAYSSVSHMSFMIAGSSLLTSWSFTGGMFMLMAHGMTSSALFAMANSYYERIKTRTLMMSRGIKKSTTLIPIFWLIFSCSKLGIPPLPKSMAEIFLFSSIMGFSVINMIGVLMTTLMTTMFSLSIFQLISSGNTFNWSGNLMLFYEREYLLLLLHVVPIFMLVTNPNMMAI